MKLLSARVLDFHQIPIDVDLVVRGAQSLLLAHLVLVESETALLLLPGFALARNCLARGRDLGLKVDKARRSLHRRPLHHGWLMRRIHLGSSSHMNAQG